MSDFVQERYTPVLIGANTTTSIVSASIGGFLCKTAGTVSLTRGISGQLVVDAFPVSAGLYYPMPFHLGTNGGTFTTAGGASGTLGVG